MSDDFSKYLKQLERIQNRMVKLYAPLDSFASQSQTLAQQLNENINLDWSQNFRTQMELTNQNIELFNSTISAQMAAVGHSFDSVIDQLNVIDSQNIANIQKWQSSIDHLVKSQSLNLSDMIPESFYAALDGVTTELENSPRFSDASHDIPTEITVKEDAIPRERKMSWGELIALLLTIWQVIFMHYADYASSLQQEEQTSEIRRQNELNEQQIEIDEQKLIISEQSLELEQKRYEYQKLLEERFDAFTESIELFITDQLDISDDD